MQRASKALSSISHLTIQLPFCLTLLWVLPLHPE